MNRKEIAHQELWIPGINFWHEGLVLSSGDFLSGEYNAMTISWGMMGEMWNRPVVQVMVRPQRYTYQFIDNSPDFTVCALSVENRKALTYLGTHSGREGEKISRAGLHPARSQKTSSPVYMEAELILECRRIYWEDVHPSQFFDPELDRNYPSRDYHRLYIGEIIYIEGIEKFRLKNQGREA